MTVTSDLKALAKSLGFAGVGIASTEPLTEAYAELRRSIRAGRMGEMKWFDLDHAERATQPARLLARAKSVVILAAPYWNSAPMVERNDVQPRGRISRYAWGNDYHTVLARHLRKLQEFLDACEPGSVTRALVDWGPLAEKAYGVRAGLGWYGKNTNLLVPGGGSWQFLADLVTTVELEPDAPLRKTCGNCTPCLPACPTDAFTSPYVLDSRRCISYLTIEHRGPIDRELRPLMGDWVFGCDLCQDVCPVNKRSAVRGWSEFRAPDVEAAVPALVPLLSLSEEEFRERFNGRAILRSKRAGFVRNVCIALGNIGDRAAVVPLANVLGDRDALVRGHAAWALGRLGGSYARTALERLYGVEADSWVREEIAHALEEIGSILRPSLKRTYHEEIVAWLGGGGGPHELRNDGARGATDTASQGAAHAPVSTPTMPVNPDEARNDEFRREMRLLEVLPLPQPLFVTESASDVNEAFRNALLGE